MRVKITYGMDLEEVPELAENLGSDALFELRKALELLSKAIENIEESNNNYLLVLDMFEKVRSILNKSDIIIVDTQKILSGLHNFHHGEQNVSERRPIMDPSGDTITETESPGEG